MKLSFAEVAIARALHDALAQARNAKAQLEAHLAADYEAVKARLEETVAHFEAEVSRLTAAVHPRILEHVAEGKHVNDSITLAEQDVPTIAEAAAAKAASEAESSAA